MKNLKDVLIKENKFEDDIFECANILMKYLPQLNDDPNDTTHDNEYIKQIGKTFGELFITIQDELHIGAFVDGINAAVDYMVNTPS